MRRLKWYQAALWQIQARRRFVALGLICMTLGIASAERSGLAVAAPELSVALNLGPSDLGWLFSAFSWTFVVAQIPAGLLVERFGVRPIIGSGLAVGALCSLLMALAGPFNSPKGSCAASQDS